MFVFTQVELNDTDLTYASIDVSEGAVNLMESAEDILTLTMDKPFSGIFFQLEAVGSYDSIVWEYLIDDDEAVPASWKRLPLNRNYKFNDSNAVQFRVPDDWERVGGDYKIRIRVEGDVDAVASMLRCYPFPTYAYTSVKDVERLLQIRKRNGITDDTNPSISDVERILMRVEGRIEGYSTQAWKPQLVTSEEHQYNRYGFVLNRYPVLDVIRLELFHGSEYREFTEGPNAEYIIDNATGRILFPRISSLPFTYNRSRHFGIGVYNTPIRVSYVWGKDIDFDVRGGMVSDIATHFAAAEILRSYDYTALIPEGTDRYAVEARINDWYEDAQERLEELRPLRMFV